MSYFRSMLVCAFAVAFSFSARAQLISSANFEPPTFTTGELEGQDGWTNYVPTGLPANTAVIQTAVARGTQALKIDSSGLGYDPGDPTNAYSYFYKPGLNYAATGKKVNVSYDLNIQPRTSGDATRSTYMLALIDDSGNFQTFVGVADDGSIYYNNAGDGGFYTPANPITETSGWNTISYTADFNTGNVAISLNGNLLPIADAIINPGVGNTIGDFDIVVLPSGYDQAVFDNIVVQAPEPGSMALLIPAIAGLMAKRRRR
jgi:hypothetical protein